MLPILVVTGTAVYILGSQSKGFPYFWVMTILIVLHGALATRVASLNLMFLFRYFLLWIIFFSTSLIWALYNGGVKVAPFGPTFQDTENTQVLVYAGFLSLTGTLSGWVMAFRRGKRRIVREYVTQPDEKRLLRIGGVSLAGLFSLLYLYVSGGVVRSGAVYVQKSVDTGVTFGVFNIFHFMGIALLVLASSGQAKDLQKYYWFAIGTLAVGMLAGSRADYLPQALLLLLFLVANTTANHNLKRWWSRLRTIIAPALGAVILAWFLGSLIAIWRTNADIGLAIDEMLTGERRGLIIEMRAHSMLNMETANMAIGTLYAAIVNVDTGITGLLWGRSYLNWLLIAPPGFLGLPRPLGLEWDTFIGDQRMSQGGIFEVAEAYWNFGLPGCFIVSFIISYLFGLALSKGLAGANYFFLTWYIVMGMMSLRAVWYQSFAYFRIFTIMALVYLMGLYFAKWFVSNRSVR